MANIKVDICGYELPLPELREIVEAVVDKVYTPIEARREPILQKAMRMKLILGRKQHNGQFVFNFVTEARNEIKSLGLGLL